MTGQPLAQIARGAGRCAHPIRLSGRLSTVNIRTGELTTSREPDRLVLTDCGNRRVARCPSCSAVYRSDTWQLVAAGLRGGKGVPASVAEHPRLFLTLTAPTFGPVHSRRTRGAKARRCRPRRGVCPHGKPVGCGQRHPPADPLLGTPLCSDCFDYPGAVLWNAHVGELWRRTIIAARRRLAASVGLTPAALTCGARLSFTKVVEYQARGLVHLHVVLRLDRGTDAGGLLEPPAAPYTADLLTQALTLAVRAVRVAVPGGQDTPAATAGWGQQLDVRPIAAGDDTANPLAIAAYIAKYATKSAEAHEPTLARQLRPNDVTRLDRGQHLQRLALTCWELGGDPGLAHLHLRRWAHMLGHRGHFATRSRAYSTTLTSLRIQRTAWTASRSSTQADAGHENELTVWRYAGRVNSAAP